MLQGGQGRVEEPPRAGPIRLDDAAVCRWAWVRLQAGCRRTSGFLTPGLRFFSSNRDAAAEFGGAERGDQPPRPRPRARRCPRRGSIVTVLAIAPIRVDSLRRGRPHSRIDCRFPSRVVRLENGNVTPARAIDHPPRGHRFAAPPATSRRRAALRPRSREPASHTSGNCSRSNFQLRRVRRPGRPPRRRPSPARPEMPRRSTPATRVGDVLVDRPAGAHQVPEIARPRGFTRPPRGTKRPAAVPAGRP